jgi:hypothetical protein
VETTNRRKRAGRIWILRKSVDTSAVQLNAIEKELIDQNRHVVYGNNNFGGSLGSDDDEVRVSDLDWRLMEIHEWLVSWYNQKSRLPTWYCSVGRLRRAISNGPQMVAGTASILETVCKGNHKNHLPCSMMLENQVCTASLHH